LELNKPLVGASNGFERLNVWAVGWGNDGGVGLPQGLLLLLVLWLLTNGLPGLWFWDVLCSGVRKIEAELLAAIGWLRGLSNTLVVPFTPQGEAEDAEKENYFH
jgi:hypothetical protein